MFTYNNILSFDDVGAGWFKKHNWCRRFLNIWIRKTITVFEINQSKSFINNIKNIGKTITITTNIMLINYV